MSEEIKKEQESDPAAIAIACMVVVGSAGLHYDSQLPIWVKGIQLSFMIMSVFSLAYGITSSSWYNLLPNSIPFAFCMFISMSARMIYWVYIATGPDTKVEDAILYVLAGLVFSYFFLKSPQVEKPETQEPTSGEP